MAMHVRLSGEGVFRRPLSYREARRLLAGLPRTRWDLALSSMTRWTPGRLSGEKPEIAGPPPSSAPQPHAERYDGGGGALLACDSQISPQLRLSLIPRATISI